jgi:tRNA uracil 4-sulfurtransferase
MKRKKAIVLLSDGIDSITASYLMKDKLDLVFVHMQMSDTKKKIKELVDKVKPKAKIYFIDYKKIQNEIRNCNRRFQCILCKRFMLRIAEKVAKKEKADFILTGENLGQVASQTLDNLKIINEAVSIPILQPLIGMNKDEIIEIAKKAETFDISIKDTAKCPHLPVNPLTRAKIDKVKYQESKLDIDKLINTITLNTS